MKTKDWAKIKSELKDNMENKGFQVENSNEIKSEISQEEFNERYEDLVEAITEAVKSLNYKIANSERFISARAVTLYNWEYLDGEQEALIKECDKRGDEEKSEKIRNLSVELKASANEAADIFAKKAAEKGYEGRFSSRGNVARVYEMIGNMEKAKEFYELEEEQEKTEIKKKIMK